jgi:hypothetical protein
MSKKRDQPRNWEDNDTSSALPPDELAVEAYGLSKDWVNGLQNVGRANIPEGSIVPQKDGTLSVNGLTITATGVELAPDTPPEKWQALGRSLLRVGNAAQWCIGDWLIFGENKAWGETYEQMAREFGYQIETLYTYAWLCRKVKISIRNRDLSPAHHRLVAKFDEEKQRNLLEWAATGDEGKPVKISQMRDMIRSLEKNDPPTLSSNVVVNAKWDKRCHDMRRMIHGAKPHEIPQMKIMLHELLSELERKEE